MDDMMNPYKIAIAGLGTVGSSLIKLLETNASTLQNRLGRKIEISAISAQNRNRDRGFDLKKYQWFDDPIAMARSPEHDLFVELIGGTQDPSLGCWQACVETNRPLVTANKALLASASNDLLEAFEARDLSIGYEAAVAASVPIIKTIKESSIGDNINQICAILNGTSNFILTRMFETQESFETILKEAQNKGYAEVDPSFDIDGTDAAHKLAILSTLAFASKVSIEDIHIEGINHISPIDLMFADDLGFAVKLLAIAERKEQGVLHRVHPALIKQSHPLSQIHGVLNAVEITSEHVGISVLEGNGAGGNPTANAVFSDIASFALNCSPPRIYSVPATMLTHGKALRMHTRCSSFYLRINVIDQRGVLAEISAILASNNISIETVIQKGHSINQPVHLIIVTHETNESDIMQSIKLINELVFVCKPCRFIRIETDFKT